MKGFKIRIKGGALYITLIISFIIFLLVSSIISVSFYLKFHMLKNFEIHKLETNFYSAINLILDEPDRFLNRDTIFELFNNKDSVHIVGKSWGMFEYFSVSAFSNSHYLSKSFFSGKMPDENSNSCLYVKDNIKPLEISGTTKIIGNCYVPSGKVKKNYSNFTVAYNNPILDGNLYKSSANFPFLENQKLISFLNGNFKLENFIRLINNVKNSQLHDSLEQSFFDSTLCVSSKERIVLKDENSLVGNIILYSKELITVPKGANLNDVILIAPSIKFENGFSGSGQFFASDSIITGKNCKFLYPSIFGLMKDINSLDFSKIVLGENAIFNGVVFGSMTGNSKLNSSGQLTLVVEKNSKINGMIYFIGDVSLKGEIDGHISCNKFFVKANSNYFENQLVNATINRKKLPYNFLIPGIFSTVAYRNILKWID